MSKRYEHTQRATFVLWCLGGGILLCLVVAVLVARSDGWAVAIIPVAVATLLVGCAWVFRSLTVQVSSDHVVARFGSGWIEKRFDAGKIRGAVPVRNHWYYGWGVRLTPPGWMYNVSGLDAVELELADGKRFRIGTDEPKRLVEAIHRLAISGRTP